MHGLQLPVRVNDVEIPETEIAAECQNHAAADAEAAREEAVRSLVVRELLLQEAARLDIEAEPQTDEAGRVETPEDARINRLLETEVATPTASEADCSRYYENNKSKFISADIYEASHILLSADRQDAEAFAAAVEEAQAIIGLLSEDPQKFADIARERSDCSSAADGGRLGQIMRGETTPEFETFLVALEAGQLSLEPVKTPYGVHVLRLDRHEPGRQLPFDAVRDRIAAYLEDASWRRAVYQYVQILVGQARIDGMELAGAKGGLVQ